MKMQFPKFDRLGMPLLGLAALALFILENKKPLRQRTRPLPNRLLENGSVAILALPALRLLLVPALYATARFANQKKFGLLPWLALPPWQRLIVGFLLLDYSNYLWHVLLHKSNLLWRFHNVHHSDMDLDLSTAWRFHIGENIFSVPYRGAAVALVGVPAWFVLFYEVIFEGCTAFHHSNLQLPFKTEQWLSRIMVTPRMHGIHHSIVARETNSNYSVIFSWWDRLHRSLRLNVPQSEIVIGTPAYQNPDEQGAKQLFLLPFAPPRPWQLPDGTIPDRREIYPKTQLCP